MKLTAKRLVIGITSLIIIVAGVGAYLFHARAEWAMDGYKKELRSRGEKLTLDEILPAPVLAESNSVAIFRKAMAVFNFSGWTGVLETNPPLAMRMVAPGKAMIGWQQPDLRDQSTNSWEDVESELEWEGEGIELLQRIIEKPVLDFQLDYRQGFSLLLPHLAQLKQSSQKLKSAAICDLRRKDTLAATKKIRATLAIVKGTTEEALIISQLVRFAMAQIAVTANWELLQSPQVTDDELASLQRDWASLEFLHASENALVLERALSEATAERMRNSSVEFRNVMGMTTPSAASSSSWVDQAGQATVSKIKESAWRYAWAYPDRLRALKGIQVIIDAVRLAERGQPFGKLLQEQDAKLAILGIQPKPRDADSMLFDSTDPRFLFSHSILSLQRFPYRLQSIEAARRLLVTAVALKRFQLSHGTNATELSALCPAFLPSVSLDPVDGNPLRYQLKPDGTFLLYSIGEDGEDNSGDATPPAGTKEYPWQRGKDQVWPRVATEAEIIAYREKTRRNR